MTLKVLVMFCSQLIVYVGVLSKETPFGTCVTKVNLHLTLNFDPEVHLHYDLDP